MRDARGELPQDASGDGAGCPCTDQAGGPVAQYAYAGGDEAGEAAPHARETMEIYAPIANRLGLNNIYHELQDLSFRYVFPTEI
jgi:hypothetical protein